MDISSYASKFVLVKKKQTPAQILAEEIWQYFSKELSFGRIMKMITENGDQCIREVFEETKKSDAKEPLALFLWSVKRNKTIWQ